MGYGRRKGLTKGIWKNFFYGNVLYLIVVMNCTFKWTHFIACKWFLMKVDSKQNVWEIAGVEAFSIQCLEKGLTHIFKTWRPCGDIEAIPTTRAPAFRPGSYGTRKLLGRFEFCRFSSFCLSCEITVIVKSTQELYEFKKLPLLSTTFPETIWCSVEEEKRVSVFEELTISGHKISQVYWEQHTHLHLPQQGVETGE